MRTATPFSTWSRITESGPSATAESISTPRFIGPGCITIASFFARRRRSGVRPNSSKYSLSDGKPRPPPRSFCTRSIMTTSAPSTASSTRVTTRAPVRSISTGSSVAGPDNVSPAPISDRSNPCGRATRVGETSPQIATRRPARDPFARRIVKASSRACVGCACAPSPAFTTAHGRCRARRCGAPERWWRMTIASGAIAMRFLPVSRSVSPFATDEPVAESAIDSAERRRSAISNEKRVRVEFSKKRFATSLPRRVGTFLMERWLISRIDSAVSRTSRMSSSVIDSMSRRSFRENVGGRGTAGSRVSLRFVVTPCAPLFLRTPRRALPRRPGSSSRRLRRNLAVEQPDVVDAVRVPERDGDDLSSRRRDSLAHELRLDRYLPAAAVIEDGEEDLSRAAEIEDGVHRGSHRAPRVDHVVAQDDRAALHRERNLRFLQDGRGRDRGQVGPIERDVEKPDGNAHALDALDLAGEASRERDSPRADADQNEAFGPAFALDDR